MVPTVVEAVDPYEFLDPVDMLEQMPKDFYEQLVCNFLCKKNCLCCFTGECLLAKEFLLKSEGIPMHPIPLTKCRIFWMGKD